MLYRYLIAPSIKHHEHMSRRRKSNIKPNMSVELENIFSEVSQKPFLSSSHNKQKFIDLLAVQLKADHDTAVRCPDDVDTVVVFTILDHVCSGSNVTAGDTNLLIVLIYFWNNLMGEITLKPEAHCIKYARIRVLLTLTRENTGHSRIFYAV